MRIDLRTVKKESTVYEENIALDIPEVNGDISAAVTVWRLSGGYEASGSLKGSYSLVCSKCLEPFQQVFEIAFRLVFRKRPVETAKESELEREELDVIYYDDDHVDLTELIRGEVLLDLPSKPLCGAGCKGICPKCGMNLNSGRCECSCEPINPAMTDLSAIKEQLYGGE